MVRVSVAVIALLLGSAAAASGQAFLPAKGEAYASVLFTNLHVENHFLPAHRVDVGHIDTNVTLFDVTYGLSDRVAVSFGIPFVISKYEGAFPHQPDNPNAPDLTGWNGNFQDFRFNVRYNLIRAGTLAVTPFIGTSRPSHGYDFVAHSAAGRQLNELQFGISAATLLDRFAPGLFVQARYGFALAEKTLDWRPNSSNLDVEVGYFISPAVRVFGMAAGRYTHSGIDLPIASIARVVLTPEQRLHHDQIVREEFFNVGLGGSIALTESLDLFGSFSKQLAGRNTHEIDRSVSMGITWNFKRRLPEEITSVLAPPADKRGEPSAIVSKMARPANSDEHTHPEEFNSHTHDDAIVTGMIRPSPASDDQQTARKSLVRCLCQKTSR